MALLEMFYVGIDWGTERHAVCVMDDAGGVERSSRSTTPRTGSFSCCPLAGYGDPADAAVAIERPDGRLVDALLEAGHPVVPVSPTRSGRGATRRCYRAPSPTPATPCVIAEYLRLRAHRLRPRRRSAQTKALRTVVRTRETWSTCGSLRPTSSLRCWTRFWPGAKAIFTDIESPIALAFLTRYPTQLPPRGWARSRWRRSVSSTATPAGGPLPSCWPGSALPLPAPPTRRGRRCPGRRAGPGRRPASAQRREKDLDHSVVAHLDEHPDAAIFTSLPRSGQISAAQVLAEWGDCPGRLRRPGRGRRVGRRHPGHQGSPANTAR